MPWLDFAVRRQEGRRSEETTLPAGRTVSSPRPLVAGTLPGRKDTSGPRSWQESGTRLPPCGNQSASESDGRSVAGAGVGEGSRAAPTSSPAREDTRPVARWLYSLSVNAA